MTSKCTLCAPTWDTARQQVFSATSSSADELSNDSIIHSDWASKMKSSRAGKLWKAAATANDNAIEINDNDNENGTRSSSSLWAAAADIPTSSADVSEDADNESNNDESSNDESNKLIFDPPQILGHHRQNISINITSDSDGD